MKTMRKIGSTIATVLMFMIFSCSADDGIKSDGNDMATYIFATVNGQSFKTYQLQGFLSAQASKSGSVITIIGMADDQSGMSILLNDITESGTYPISNMNAANRIGYSNSGVTVSSVSQCEGVAGSIIITEINDAKIEGTFSIIANNSDCTEERTITNGSFRGTFTND